ncbi:MAG: hypothetical protein AAF849_03235 [Bacteroidota bacterium]
MPNQTLTSDQLRTIIKKGVTLLRDDTRTTYSQKQVVDKLAWLKQEYTISKPFLNKVLKQNKGAKQHLVKVALGIQELIRKELLHEYNFEEEQFEPIDDPELEISVVEPPSKDNIISITSNQTALIAYANGRLSIQEKVDFFKDAQEEVVLMGVRLKRFAGYLIGRQDNEFKAPLVELLKRNVKVRTYVLDPDWEHTLTYFDDRSTGIPLEKKSPSTIIDTIQEIHYGMQDVNKEEWGKNFELYAYAHLPQGYYLAVDGFSDNGKLHFAPYLFGTLRKDVPVFEVIKATNPILFDKLWGSLNKIRSNAKLIQAKYPMQ